MVNISKDVRDKNLDANRKIKRVSIPELISELYNNKDHTPSNLEIIDLHKKNPDSFEKDEEAYQIKYKW